VILSAVRRKDLHDQLGRSSRDGCHQRHAQDRLCLVDHVYRGGSYLRPSPSGECSTRLLVEADRYGLSRVVVCGSRFNPKGSRGHVVLLGTGEGCHAERAPVAIVEVQESSRSSMVARARVARHNRLAGGLCNHRGTRWRWRWRCSNSGAYPHECGNSHGGERRHSQGPVRPGRAFVRVG
jgi:hypothetical protein